MSEALAKYAEAEEIYRTLRMTCEQQGHHRTSGEFFYREMLMRHRRLPRGSLEYWVSSFARFLYGYGERPAFIIANALVYLAGMAVLYLAIGLVEGDRPVVFDAAAGWGANLVAYGKCLYFSIITYTTVGYGDITPVDVAKPLAALEALSGNFMMALFVVVFVRKLAR